MFKRVKEKLFQLPHFKPQLPVSFPPDLPACSKKKKKERICNCLTCPTIRPASPYTQAKHTLQIHKANTLKNHTQTPEQDKQEHTSQQPPKDPTSPLSPRCPQASHLGTGHPAAGPSHLSAGHLSPHQAPDLSLLPTIQCPLNTSPVHLKPVFIKHLLGRTPHSFCVLATPLVTLTVISSSLMVLVIQVLSLTQSSLCKAAGLNLGSTYGITGSVNLGENNPKHPIFLCSLIFMEI